MKRRKIMDGVYEGESFKPEPLYGKCGDGTQYCKYPDDKLAERVRACVVDGEVRHTYHYRFQVNHFYGANQPMHRDGSMNYSTHVLVMIACENPELGTEIQRPDGRVFKCKTWTPYLFRGDTDHRAATNPWDCERFMYRFFFKLDESRLDITTDSA
jgi:hypothetical protein